jgi:hypothetical protein
VLVHQAAGLERKSYNRQFSQRGVWTVIASVSVGVYGVYTVCTVIMNVRCVLAQIYVWVLLLHWAAAHGPDEPGVWCAGVHAHQALELVF